MKTSTSIGRVNGNSMDKNDLKNDIEIEFIIPTEDSATENKKPKKIKNVSIQQLETILEQKFDFRLNEISNKLYWKPKDEHSAWELVNENELYRILHKEQVLVSLQTIKILLGSHFVPVINPLKDFFTSTVSLYSPQMHGDYISTFLSFCKVEDTELLNSTFKVWMVNTVRTVFEDKAFNKVIFVIFNTVQNSGKTSLARFIIPDFLREYFMENQLDSTKDGLITLTKCMVHLLDEMAVVSSMGFQSFKSIISKDKVDVRPPYGANIISKPRITSFIGTSDQFGFLNEDVGTARFIVQEIKSIDFGYTKRINPTILWAQAFFHYQRKEYIELSETDKRKVAEGNRRFIRSSYLTECITEVLQPSDKNNGEFLQTKDIVKLLQNQFGSQNISDRKIGDSLNALGFYRIKHYCTERKNSFYGYYVKRSTRSDI